MASNGDWCLIESDPGVFTELIRNFGVSGVQVEELYTLELDHLRELAPIHGLIFLFKYHVGEEPTGQVVPNASGVYFAQQVISNACATQAILNLLLNVKSDEVNLGNILEQFYAFSKDMDPASRGLCLSNSEEIRKYHNAFSRPALVEIEGPQKGKEDAYHFVTYVPVNGHVYELDGLKDGPVDIGKIPEGKDWLDVVHGTLNARIERHTHSEITFNLMAVVADRKQKYEKELTLLESSDINEEEKANQRCRLQMAIQEEQEKMTRYKDENIRRRHNYTPFIVELLKALAKENKLNGLLEKAAKEASDRQKAQKST
ncbi:UNVERIFIED_CONTAM: Ubiquitin carboxyl-terminal hydrolase isozyme L5, partial [Eudyptes robustus]|uniref:Ubiquitin carboxyl-terminal hydrolase n=1 Tax=Bursaphelenchus xylophilus TaxID=6326 RepID=A0A1I7SDE7_BURXY